MDSANELFSGKLFIAVKFSFTAQKSNDKS